MARFTRMMTVPSRLGEILVLRGGLYKDRSIANNAVTNNSTTLTTDHAGRANRAFAGDMTQMIRVANSETFNFGDTLSVEAIYANEDNTTSVAGIVAKFATTGNQRAFSLYNGADKLAVTISAGGVDNQKLYQVNSAITNNVYNYHSFSYKSNVLKLFNRAVEITDVTKTTDDNVTNIFNSSADVTVFSRLGGTLPANYLKGKISSVTLRKRDLPVTEQQKKYNFARTH